MAATMQFFARTELTCIALITLLQLSIWVLADSPVCKTPECQEMGNYYKKNIDKNGKPCVDFYEYACHGWLAQTPKPKHISFWTPERDIQQRTDANLKKVLEERRYLGNMKFEQVKTLYTACMRTPHLKRLSPSMIRTIMSKVSEWPILHPKNKPLPVEHPWQIDNRFLKITGESALFTLMIQGDSILQTEFVTAASQLVSPYGMLLHSVDWNNPSELQHYKMFLSKIVHSVAPQGSKLSKETIDADLNDVINLREDLNEILAQRSIEKPKRSKIKDFQEFYNSNVKHHETADINFLEDIRAIYKGPIGSYQFAINELSIVTYERAYFLRLAEVLGRTPKRTILNHIFLYFLERHLELDSQMIADLEQSVDDGLIPSGKIRYEPERWQKCISSINMKASLAKLYLHTLFPGAVKTEVEHLFNEAKHILDQQIHASNWLNAHTKAAAKQKLHNLKATIGYPNAFMSSHEMFEDFQDDPLRGETQYQSRANNIFLSAAFLQWPMYAQNMPYVIDYGTIVTALGHEMYHAFDNNGIQNQNWDREMIVKFDDQSNCFRDQYTKYRNKEIQHLKMNVTRRLPNTVNEDIADVMGLKLAYQGYRKMLAKNNNRCVVLPGFEKDGCEKLFFISFANTFCVHSTTATNKRYIMVDPHSMFHIRVNGAVANMPEFSQAFKCKAGDPLKLPKPCDIWQH